MSKSSGIIIAHRGESFNAPENTLASIILAWNNKARAVEIDIHLTNDNEIVVIHDYDTLRTSGKKKIIKSATLQELRLLDFGSFKNKKWKNERIPTLSEVLKTVPSGCKLIIEIKSDHRILDRLKFDLAQSRLKNSQIELIAFNVNTLAKAKQMMPEYRMLWLINLDYYWPYWIIRVNKQQLINKVKKHNLNGVDVWAGKFLNSSFIEKFQKAGLLVYAWTVDNPEKANTLLENGIDGITTNRPGWITEQLKHYNLKINTL